MPNVDFLPELYRQRRSRYRVQPWRVAVLAGLGGLLVAAAVSQQYQIRRMRSQMATITPVYDLTVDQKRQLTALEAQLQTVRNEAELYSYLRHPWPRTQLIIALLGSLPEGVHFEELSIVRETVAPTGLPDPRAAAPKPDEDPGKLSAYERDLRRMREQWNKTRIAIHVTGTTASTAALHRYLGDLARNSLFINAELDSFESVPGNSDTILRFRAKIVVKPGYGQPNGPSKPPASVLARLEQEP